MATLIRMGSLYLGGYPSGLAQNNGTSRTRHWFPVREPAVASAKTNLPRCISPGKKTRSPTNIEFKPLAYHPTGTQF